jgi:hypothetical protein
MEKRRSELQQLQEVAGSGYGGGYGSDMYGGGMGSMGGDATMGGYGSGDMYAGMGGDSTMGGYGGGSDMYSQMGSMGGDAAMGSMGGMGGMGGQMPGRDMGAPLPTPGKYKLVRFFDFDVKPGRQYRYRVRLLYHDLNYPANPQVAPSLQSLKQEVLVRVMELIKKDEAINKKREAEHKADPKTREKPFFPTRSYKLASDWSQPSKVIQTTSLFSVALGPATAIGKGVEPVSSQSYPSPRAKLVINEFEVRSSRALEITRYDDIERGSLITGEWRGKKELEVINPINKQIILFPEKEKFAFRSAVTVIDLRASDRLAYDDARKDPLGTALEAIIFDARSGEMMVADEFDDFDRFRMYTFAKEHEAAAKSQQNTAGAGPGGMPGYGGSDTGS